MFYEQTLYLLRPGLSVSGDLLLLVGLLNTYIRTLVLHRSCVARQVLNRCNNNCRRLCASVDLEDVWARGNWLRCLLCMRPHSDPRSAPGVGGSVQPQIHLLALYGCRFLNNLGRFLKSFGQSISYVFHVRFSKVLFVDKEDELQHRAAERGQLFGSVFGSHSDLGCLCHRREMNPRESIGEPDGHRAAYYNIGDENFGRTEPQIVLVEGDCHGCYCTQRSRWDCRS